MRLPALHRVENDVRVTYTIGNDESILIAIIEAFRAMDSMDSSLDDRETVLEDWIDTDALEQLCQTSDSHLRVSTIIWEHPVSITPETIQIFAKQIGHRTPLNEV
jgi:hypothetical protein